MAQYCVVKIVKKILKYTKVYFIKIMPIFLFQAFKIVLLCRA